MSQSLVAAFDAALATGNANGVEDTDRATLAKLLNDFVGRARAETPELGIDDVQLLSGLARQVGNGVEIADLAKLHAGDLGLATATLARDANAEKKFEQLHMTSARRVVARIRSDESFVDEVVQDLRTHLLVGPDPKLARYSGLGPLAGWVRVVATRTAISAIREEKRLPFDAELVSLIDSNAGPGVPLGLQTALEEAVRAAFSQNLAENEPRVRAVMRMYYADGLELTAIAKVYRVHESTVSRWIATARERIRDAAYAALRTQLRLTRSEADSVLGMAVDLEVSIRSLLQMSEQGRE